MKVDFSGFPSVGGSDSGKMSSGINLNNILEKASEADQSKISAGQDKISLSSKKIDSLLSLIDLLKIFHNKIQTSLKFVDSLEYLVSDNNIIEVDLYPIEVQEFLISDIKAVRTQQLLSYEFDSNLPLYMEGNLAIYKNNQAQFDFGTFKEVEGDFDNNNIIIGLKEIGPLYGKISTVLQYIGINEYDSGFSISLIIDDIEYISDIIDFNSQDNKAVFRSDHSSFELIIRDGFIDLDSIVENLLQDLDSISILQYNEILINSEFCRILTNAPVEISTNSCILSNFSIVDDFLSCNVNGDRYFGIIPEEDFETILLYDGGFKIEIRFTEKVLVNQIVDVINRLNNELGIISDIVEINPQDDLYSIASKIADIEYLKTYVIKSNSDKSMIVIEPQDTSKQSIFHVQNQGLSLTQKNNNSDHVNAQIKLNGITLKSNNNIFTVNDNFTIKVLRDQRLNESNCFVRIYNDIDNLLFHIREAIDCYNALKMFWDQHHERNSDYSISETSLLYDSISLDSVYKSIKNFFYRNSEFFISIGLRFNSSSYVVIDESKFHDLSDLDRNKLSDVLNDLSNLINDSVSYSGSIRNEINLLSERSKEKESEIKKVNKDSERKKQALVKQFSKLEHSVSKANQALWFIDTLLNQDKG